jgi:hypothetical protein
LIDQDIYVKNPDIGTGFDFAPRNDRPFWKDPRKGCNFIIYEETGRIADPVWLVCPLPHRKKLLLTIKQLSIHISWKLIGE